MKINKIINFVILGLVATAVIQTGKLWLGDMTSHNFFYTVFASLGDNYTRTLGNVEVIEAEKIAVGYGNKKFSIIYPTNENSITGLGNQVIKETLSKGKYIGTSDINWNDYLNSKAVVYSYSFPVSILEYTKGFKEKAEEVTSNVKSFDEIAIVPSRNSTEELNVYFINNSEFHEAYCFSLDRSGSGEKLYAAIEKYQQTYEGNLIYNSTIQSGFYLIKNNVFVPQWTQESLKYSSLKRVNPYASNGIVYKDLLENGLSSFFTNQSAKWDEQDESGVYMFSDENNVVKYYEDGILEYYNYDTYESSNEQTLATAYTASQNFLKKDSTLKTGIFLADVELRSDGLLVFSYDYTVDNLPVLISNDVKEKSNISHAVEVTVKSDTVKRYKRYAYNFEISETNDSTANMDFITAVDNSSKDNLTEIQDITLGYCVENNDSVKLKWFTEINDEIFISNVLK